MPFIPDYEHCSIHPKKTTYGDYWLKMQLYPDVTNKLPLQVFWWIKLLGLCGSFSVGSGSNNQCLHSSAPDWSLLCTWYLSRANWTNSFLSATPLHNWRLKGATANWEFLELKPMTVWLDRWSQQLLLSRAFLYQSVHVAAQFLLLNNNSTAHFAVSNLAYSRSKFLNKQWIRKHAQWVYERTRGCFHKVTLYRIGLYYYDETFRFWKPLRVQFSNKNRTDSVIEIEITHII